MPRRGDIPKGGVRRSAAIASSVGGQGARIAGAMLRGDDPARIEQAHLEAAERMAAVLGTMKGGAMKVGQLASFVELGMVPPQYRRLYQEQLAALRDAAPSVSFDDVRRVIEEELEAPLDHVFAEFEPRPAAAASIGQVHRAALPGGRTVAVKVQYPGVAEALEADVRTASVLLPIAKAIAPGLDPRPLAAELRERMLEELDYELEAAGQRRFARAYRDHPFAVVPDVVTRLSRRRVLVSDWVDGRPFEVAKALPQPERDRLGEIIFRFYWGGLHLMREINADPHPGNYLLLDDGRAAFLDFGSLRTFTEDQVRRQVDMVLAGIRGDAEGLLRAQEELGYVRSGHPLEAQALLEYFRWYAPHLVADEEIAFNADALAERLLTLSDPRSPQFRIARRQNLPGDYLMLHRLEVSVVAVLSQLGARRNWQRIVREYWFGDPPSTELGEAEAAWRQRRAA